MTLLDERLDDLAPEISTLLPLRLLKTREDLVQHLRELIDFCVRMGLEFEPALGQARREWLRDFEKKVDKLAPPTEDASDPEPENGAQKGGEIPATGMVWLRWGKRYQQAGIVLERISGGRLSVLRYAKNSKTWDTDEVDRSDVLGPREKLMPREKEVSPHHDD